MIELRVNDMTCGHCVTAVARAVKSVDPEADVQVDLESKRVRVSGRSSAEALSKALAHDAGPDNDREQERRSHSFRHRSLGNRHVRRPISSSFCLRARFPSVLIGRSMKSEIRR